MHQAFELARQNMGLAVQRQRKAYSRKVVSYAVGGLVWLFTPTMGQRQVSKMSTGWSGPWKVIKCHNHVTYSIELVCPPGLTPRIETVGIDRLRAFAQDESAEPPPPGRPPPHISGDLQAEGGNERPRPLKRSEWTLKQLLGADFSPHFDAGATRAAPALAGTAPSLPSPPPSPAPVHHPVSPSLEASAGSAASPSFHIHSRSDRSDTPGILHQNRNIIRDCLNDDGDTSFRASRSPPPAPRSSPAPLIPKGLYERLDPAATRHNRRVRFVNRTGAARNVSPQGMQSTRADF